MLCQTFKVGNAWTEFCDCVCRLSVGHGVAQQEAAPAGTGGDQPGNFARVEAPGKERGRHIPRRFVERTGFPHY